MAPLHDQAICKLEQNNNEVLNEAVRLLTKVAENILKNPNNPNIRTLRNTNKLVKTKILDVKGGKDCLLIMGFLEKNDCFMLPENASLNNLKEVKITLAKLQESKSKAQEKVENVFALLREDSQPESNSNLTDSEASTSSDESLPDTSRKRKTVTLPNNISLVQFPPPNYTFTDPFLHHIESRFYAALAYSDKNLIEKAKTIIPIKRFEENAQKRLRKLQEQVKKGNLNDPDITIQEMMLLELLDWFKNDFFSWVDCPECQFCSGKTKFVSMSKDPSVLIYTNRVEVYTCETCNQITHFPRYNDVNILLITRRGRCGEWANTFTLLCTAMGWDARFIEDQTDHVWTEVFSFGQKRWLHCDPCENVCDSPLMYESGWKKQVSYIIAYSPEEVQDVTWRYTSHHKDILKRRQKCSEIDLVNCLVKLRSSRQINFSKSRQEYLAKRILLELVELMKEKNPNENEKEGRSSGSLEWRLARGETNDSSYTFSPFVWNLTSEDCQNGRLKISYSASQDKYIKETGNGNRTVLNEWSAGVSELENVFRKEEKDWKMVYLARNEGANSGKISWKFELNTTAFVLDTVDVKFERKLYENGQVNVQICSENTCLNLAGDKSRLTSSAFQNSKTLSIKATLSGGRGDVAWQHSQLFRQEISSKDYPFEVTFTFKTNKQ